MRAKETKAKLIQKLGTNTECRVPVPIYNSIREKDISVIVPVYNAEAFIEHCAVSILSQKGDFSWEIIFIDDGSTDKSLQILQKTIENWRKGNGSESKPDIVCISQDNKGAGAARNRGLYIARGEYIAFVDSDDALGSPYYLSDLFLAAKAEDADICQEGMTKEKDGVKISAGWNPKWNYTDKYHTFRNLPGYVTAKLIRKSLFDGIWFPEGRCFEDTIMQLVVYPRCKNYCLVNKEDYIYRIHTESVTYRKNKGDKGVDAVLVVNECLQMVRHIRLKVGVLWYEVLLNHFKQLLFTRIRHCSFFAIRNSFLLACNILDEAAILSGANLFRPFDGADFYMQHRMFFSWCIRCIFHKTGLAGIRKSKERKVVSCRQYQQ